MDPLTNEDVADILALLDSLPYDEFDLETPRFRLTLRRTPAGWTQSTQILSAPKPLAAPEGATSGVRGPLPPSIGGGGPLTPVGDEHPPQDHSSALIRSSAAPCATSSAFVTQNSATTPATPAGTEFISFIVSTMPITVSAPTRLPTSTNGAAPGRGAR